MLLYLLRHGIAEAHGSRRSDDERELTEEGMEKTKLALKAVRAMKLEQPSLIIASPYIRAQQTAEIAHREFGSHAQLKNSEVLIPSGDITSTMSLVAEYIRDNSPLMLVGHEPHLSTFASAILGSSSTIIEMKKASLAVIELFRLDTPRMRGVLTALLPPKIGNTI